MSTKMRGIIKEIISWVLVIVMCIGCIACVIYGVEQHKRIAIEREEYRMKKAEYLKDLERISDGLVYLCAATYAANYGNK